VKITTLYGTYDVIDPLLCELIEHRAIQRLKYISQSGPMSYTHRALKEWSRYDHSLGVLTLLIRYKCSREEQIAGLLHDVSHTIFSHVGDFVFSHFSHNESYQDSVYHEYLKKSGLESVLLRHGLSLDSVHNLSEKFPALEKDLPGICADRLDYNLTAGVKLGCLTQCECEELLLSLHFDCEKKLWFFDNLKKALKLGEISLWCTENVWGSVANYLIYIWCANALKRACDIKIISLDDICYGTDDDIWARLTTSNDEQISGLIGKILHHDQHYRLANKGEMPTQIIYPKFRALDPLVLSHAHPECFAQRNVSQNDTNVNYLPLTQCDKEYQDKYTRVRENFSKGIPVVVID